METVTQKYDDYSVFEDSEIKQLVDKVIGQKIVSIHGVHDRSTGGYLLIRLGNGHELTIGAMDGDFSTYIATRVDLKK